MINLTELQSEYGPKIFYVVKRSAQFQRAGIKILARWNQIPARFTALEFFSARGEFRARARGARALHFLWRASPSI